MMAKPNNLRNITSWGKQPFPWGNFRDLRWRCFKSPPSTPDRHVISSHVDRFVLITAYSFFSLLFWLCLFNRVNGVEWMDLRIFVEKDRLYRADCLYRLPPWSFWLRTTCYIILLHHLDHAACGDVCPGGDRSVSEKTTPVLTVSY